LRKFSFGIINRFKTNSPPFLVMIIPAIISNNWWSKLYLIIIKRFSKKILIRAGTHQTFAEGASINQPSHFTKENYPFWKVHMRIILESIDRGVWNAIVNGSYIPKVFINGKEIEKDFNSWTLKENRCAQYNVRAKNIIASALMLDEFYFVPQCANAREIWKILEVTHTTEVKRARKNTLI